MGRAIYLINGIFGVVLGLIVGIGSGFVRLFCLLPLDAGCGFSGTNIGFFIGGAIAVAFGVYQLKKFKDTKKPSSGVQ